MNTPGWWARFWQSATKHPYNDFNPWQGYDPSLMRKEPALPMITITKEYTFESGHILPWHQGKCGRPHGHSYILQVEVAGRVKPDNGEPDAGMVMDFADISTVVKPLLNDYLDHRWLNDSLGLTNPTAENIVVWIADHLAPELPGLASLRLYETSTGWVTWKARS